MKERHSIIVQKATKNYDILFFFQISDSNIAPRLGCINGSSSPNVYMSTCNKKTKTKRAQMQEKRINAVNIFAVTNDTMIINQVHYKRNNYTD